MKTKLIAIVALALTFCAIAAPAQFASQSQPQGLYLSVLRAQRYNDRGMTMTNIVGTLSDDPDTQLHMVCDVGIFSIGTDGNVGNKYPAYRNKPGQIKISSHDMGSQKVHEHTCKY